MAGDVTLLVDLMPDSQPETSYRDHEREAGAPALAFAVLTFSDTRNLQTDRSGAAIRELAEEAGHRIAAHEVVPDDPDAMRAALERMFAIPDVDVVVTNGGTGISMRDSACEVMQQVLEKRLDGFGELFRMLSYQEIGAAAMLSRASGGIRGRTVLFSLPGSSNAVRLGMSKLILPQAAHLVRELRKHESGAD